MTKPRKPKATPKNRPPEKVAPAAAGQETKAQASDSDTERKKEPKGSGIGFRRKAGRLAADGGDSGGSDTGGGGGPKTGLQAVRRQRIASEPVPDPKKPPKTGIGAKKR